MKNDDCIDPALDTLFIDNPDMVERIKTNPNGIDWFIGQVMKATHGGVNPSVVREKLQAKLNSIR